MSGMHPDPDLIALGVRQPWVELILRGIKTIEVRSQETNVRGPIYLYSSKKPADIPPAKAAIKSHRLNLEKLHFGLLVGTVEIVESRPCNSDDANAACVPASYLENRIAWRLENPVRFETPLTVRFLPYGVWFYPFKRRGGRKRTPESRRKPR